MNQNEFEQTLTDMSIRSQAFQAVKREMIKRGHWKAKDRGISGKELNSKSKSRLLDIHSFNPYQSKQKIGFEKRVSPQQNDDDFNDW